MTVTDALTLASGPLGRREAVLLLCHVTDMTHAGILIHGTDFLTAQQEASFKCMMEKRLNGEPLQYIFKRWPFYGLELTVDARALIPRPETELLVEAALRYNKERGRGGTVRILDMCAGSGCIGMALAKNADARVTAADIDPGALSLARENAARLGVAEKFRFIVSDVFDQIPPEPYFDIIVSNPPYIPSREVLTLDKGIVEYEPLRALDGGADGLDIYRRLIPRGLDYLRPGGALFLEIGPREGVVSLMERSGYGGITVLNDYAGLARVVIGGKSTHVQPLG